jgi:thioredoxin reductase (NADPH)
MMRSSENLATMPKIKAAKKGGQKLDVMVIGAGPTGLACAIEAKRVGAKVLLVDKGCLVNSLVHYPTNMLFFTTPELLEVGDIPFSSANQKPTREEALQYYRNVAQHYELDIQQYQRVMTVAGKDNDFHVTTVDLHNQVSEYVSRKIVVATGYYDLPNHLNIPGEDLPKVLHYYKEPYPYFDTDVVVIGGKNSAAITALDLWRHGARVTLVHRSAELHNHIKYWILPDIQNRIRNKEIAAHFSSQVQEITPESVHIETPKGPVELKNDFVFALTGYHPDYDFLRSMGIELIGDHQRPVCDPQTLESNVRGIYVAGVILAGSRTNEIFIENGRFHGKHIAADLKAKL